MHEEIMFMFIVSAENYKLLNQFSQEMNSYDLTMPSPQGSLR